MNVKLFTHIKDLDGIGNAVLAKLSFNNVDISFCDYHEPIDINKMFKEFIDSQEYHNYDKIFVTDISINEDNAGFADMFFPEKMVLLDHHKTAMWLNNYKWAIVSETVNHVLTCGTELFFLYLIDPSNTTDHKFDTKSVAKFVNLTVDCDTWQWEKKNNLKARQLADLLEVYGKERFIKKYVEYLQWHEDLYFDETDKFILQLEDEHRQNYIKEKSEQIIHKNIDGYNAGIIFSEKYASDLGNELAKSHPELDFIAMISGTGISYRGIKDNVDLGAIAKKHGGGGHPKAAGGPVTDKQKEQIINLIFGK